MFFDLGDQNSTSSLYYIQPFKKMIIKNINNIITTIIFNNPTRQPKQPSTMPNNILKNILIAGHTITTIIANII